MRCIVNIYINDRNLLETVMHLITLSSLDSHDGKVLICDGEGFRYCRENGITVGNHSVILLDNTEEEYPGISYKVIRLPLPLNYDKFTRAFINEMFDAQQNNTDVANLSFNKKGAGAILCSGEKHVKLSSLESKLFLLLSEHSHQIVSREMISQALWNEGCSASNRADVYVSYLRNKLKKLDFENSIVSVSGKGYIYVP